MKNPISNCNNVWNAVISRRGICYTSFIKYERGKSGGIKSNWKNRISAAGKRIWENSD